MPYSSTIFTMFLISQCSRSFHSLSLSLARRSIFGIHRLQLSSKATIADIEFYNEQRSLKNIDEDSLKETISKIRSILGYDHYSVSLALMDDEEIQKLNMETRNVDAPTDILSFPMHDAIKPGVLEKPQFEIPDLYCLGDIMIDVPYVMRQCKEDEEWEYEDEDEKGVSAAMAEEFDAEKRLHMLLVHGMLHLVGYDHIEDDDFELMVAKEDGILQELKLVPQKGGDVKLL